MKSLKTWVLEIFSVLLLLPALAGAAPSQINYQGRLVDANGNPLSGSYSITFNIYGALTGGAAVWTENQPTVAVDNGIFNAKLGSQVTLPPSVFSSDTRYLGVTIGSDPEMSPRVQLLSVPYAIYAASAAYAVGSDIADGQVTNAKIATMDAAKLTGILPAIDGAALTNIVVSAVPAIGVQAGSLGAGVIASSVAVNAVQDASVVGVSGSKVSGNITGNAANITGNLAAAQIAAGTLPSSVIASSVAVNSVYDGAIAGMSSSKLTGDLPAISGAALTGIAASAIADDAVTTAKILDANVTSAKLAGGIDAAKIGSGAVGNTQFGYLANLASDVQVQLDSKAVAADVAADTDTLKTALDLKAPLASPAFTGTVTGITKAMVGLTSVDDTSDANKPVSTAQQTALDLKAVAADVAADTDTLKTALDLKAPLASPAFTGTVTGITKAMVGLTSVDDTSDAGKPVSTAQQAALDVKVSSALTNGSIFIGDVANAAAAQAVSGDATISNTGVLTLGTVAVGKGGTGATTAAAARSNLGAVGRVSINTTQMATGGTIEETLMSYAIPAGTLSADGKGVKIRAWGTTVANANAKTIRVKFGATTLITNAVTASPNGDKWSFEAMVFRTGASAQDAIATGIVGAVNEAVAFTSPAADTTAGITIALTGETPTATGDLAAEGLYVELVD